jgi:hypothetical protein
VVQPEEEFGPHTSTKWSIEPVDRGICHPGKGPVDGERINFRAVDGPRDSEPENLAETQGFEPWIRL